MYTVRVIGLPYVSIHHSEIEHFPLINHKKEDMSGKREVKGRTYK
jgi:hypothetical protein